MAVPLELSSHNLLRIEEAVPSLQHHGKTAGPVSCDLQWPRRSTRGPLLTRGFGNHARCRWVRRSSESEVDWHFDIDTLPPLVAWILTLSLYPHVRCSLCLDQPRFVGSTRLKFVFENGTIRGLIRLMKVSLSFQPSS